MSTTKEFFNANDIVTKLVDEVIKQRRFKETGKPIRRPSDVSRRLLTALLKVIIKENCNEITMPLSKLKTILDSIETNNVSRDMKTYFKNYGLGDFVSTKKHKIFKESINGQLTSESIKADSTYVFYINQETLELMRDSGLCEDLDYDKLISDIPRSKEVLKLIPNRKTTEVVVRTYITDEYYIDKLVEIEKDFNTNEGTYKESIIENVNGIETVKSVSENGFTLSPKHKEIVRETEEKVHRDFENVEQRTNCLGKKGNTNSIVRRKPVNNTSCNSEEDINPLDRIARVMSKRKLAGEEAFLANRAIKQAEEAVEFELEEE